MKYFPIKIDTESNLDDNLSFSALPPLSLYVHYPWCIKKCPYCDFNSHAMHFQSILDEQTYLEALILDLQQQLPLIWNRMVNTIFIGGGTPNLISSQGINYLLNQLRALLPLRPNAEITLEANPGVFSKQKLQDYYKAGVNRMSIGVQSLSSNHLKALGRIHTPQEALQTIETAQNIFPSVNADLMYGLPFQNIQDAESDIQQIVKTGISHISAYQLTIEPNTWFYRHPPTTPAESELFEIEQTIHNTLRENAYHRYEISAFAQDKHQCQHNLNYWRFGDYIGIGAGAHGKLTFHDKVVRTQHKKNPKDYIKSIHTTFTKTFQQPITQEELNVEFMMNALRLTDGFPISLYTQTTGLNLHNIQHSLSLAQSKHFIHIQNNKIRPTALGLNFLNDLIQLFL